MNNRQLNPNNQQQPKMPRFNMNWLYIIVAVVLAIMLFSGGGNSIVKGGSSQEASYSDFKTYVEKGYAQRIVINKSDNTLKMFVKPQYIRTVFNMSAQQVGTSPWVSVQFGSVDELEKFLDSQQQKHKFAGYSYDNERGSVPSSSCSSSFGCSAAVWAAVLALEEVAASSVSARAKLSFMRKETRWASPSRM